MRQSLFMYLFFFAMLFVLFQYINEKKIFEKQENKIESQNKIITTLKEDNIFLSDTIVSLSDKILDIDYFTLEGNENAITYFEDLGYDASEIKNLVSEYIYENNLVKGNNPLVPYEGMQGGNMKINKIKFLNHKWILADFTDGNYWGEMILEYFVSRNKKIEIKAISSLLYPLN